MDNQSCGGDRVDDISGRVPKPVGEQSGFPPEETARFCGACEPRIQPKVLYTNS
jgi:hypothetical protein